MLPPCRFQAPHLPRQSWEELLSHASSGLTIAQRSYVGKAAGIILKLWISPLQPQVWKMYFFFFFLTQSNFLSWAPILPNVENQSYRFRGTWSSSQTSQSIQDSIAFTSRDQPPFRQTLGAVELCLSHRQFGSFHTALVTWAGVWGHASFSGSSSHPRDGALSTPTTSCPNFRIHSWCPRQLPGPLMCLPSGAEVGIRPHHCLSPCRRVIQWLLSGWEGQSPPQAPTRSTLFTNTWVWIRVP